MFDVVGELHRQEPLFRKGCHYNIHPVGEAAYKLYAETQRTDFMILDASACNYGFYHGFILALFADTGDIVGARHFCESLRGPLTRERPDLLAECYHGMAHGFLDQYAEQEKEKPESLEWVKRTLRSAHVPALADCDTVTEESVLRGNCYSGVFHEAAMLSEARGWATDAEDPLWLCRETKPEYREHCAANMHRLVTNMMPDAGLLEVIEFTESVYGPESPFLPHIVWRWGYLQPRDFSLIEACRTAPSSFLSTRCIDGGIAGLMEGGNPDTRYLSAGRLCSDVRLRDAERNACTNASFSRFLTAYSEEKVKEICNTFSSVYASKCEQL